jgi:hypothetical protein
VFSLADQVSVRSARPENLFKSFAYMQKTGCTLVRDETLVKSFIKRVRNAGLSAKASIRERFMEHVIEAHEEENRQRAAFVIRTPTFLIL